MKIIHSKEYNAPRHSVIWENVPLFQPTSTNDPALQFISKFGGKDKTLFEFGTWVGRSALGFSQNFGKVVTMDFIASSDINYSYNFEGVPMVSGELVKNCENVVCIQEDSMKYDFSHFLQTFDVVYVDGNHSYNGCMSDLHNAMLIAKKTNSHIFVDDYANDDMGVRQAVSDFSHPDKIFFADLGIVLLKN